MIISLLEKLGTVAADFALASGSFWFIHQPAEPKKPNGEMNTDSELTVSAS